MFKNVSRFKKIFIICCSGILLLVGVMAMKSFSQPQKQDVVPVEVAGKVAENKVNTTKLFKEWYAATVSSEEAIIFFDLAYHPSVYMFKVIKDHQYVGYITVSASFEFYPVREYSSAPFPLENLERCKQQASSHIGPLSETYELIYLGGTTYLVKFFSVSGNSIVVGLSPFGMVFPEENLKQAQLFLEEKASEIRNKAKLGWEKYN